MTSTEGVSMTGVVIPADSWAAFQAWVHHIGLVLHQVPASPVQAPRFELHKRPAGPPPGGLTTREIQVLTAMAHGKPNKSIARELGLSAQTVKSHLRRIYRKFNVGDRAHAVAIGFQIGLLR